MQIGRQVGIALEDSQSTFGLHTDPAAGDVRDTAIGEADPGVGDVDIVREYRAPHCVDTLHRRAYETVDEIDIVDHQIQHYAHIESTRLVGCDPVRLDELWLIHVFRESYDSRIEALEVSYLQHERFFCRQFDEFMGLVHRGCYRFLQQYVDAIIQQCARNLEMRRRRRGDRDRADIADQVVIIQRIFHAEPRGDGTRTITVDVDDPDEL